MPSKLPNSPHRPAIVGLDPWLPGDLTGRGGNQLLSEEQRIRLTTIASIVRFAKGQQIYEEGGEATTIYNVIGGVVKAYQTAPNGSEYIAAFLYRHDLFGLSTAGRYVCSTRAITPVTAYAFPVAAVRRTLSSDAALDYNIVVKLCHELRQAQRHAFLLAQKHAITRVAMFLQLQEHLQAARGDAPDEIYLPMKRSDVADFVGISPSAVTRAFRTLIRQGLIESRDRRHVHIRERQAFDRLAAAIPAELPEEMEV